MAQALQAKETYREGKRNQKLLLYRSLDNFRKHVHQMAQGLQAKETYRGSKRKKNGTGVTGRRIAREIPHRRAQKEDGAGAGFVLSYI